MKVSLNIVKQFTDVDLPVDELVMRINQQLGKAEEVTDLGTRYKGAVIAQIVSCADHPDADRLHVCRIDDGGITPDVERDSDGFVQVVCGAPNAREGIHVVWLPPGSTVPSSHADPEPFVLGSRPLRGVLSHGMLASPRELGIGDSHEGILEIDPTEWSPRQDQIKPGASFSAVYGLDDTIIDIENKMFTHRPDCFGIIGVAREIAGIQHKPFKSPDWYAKSPEFVGAEGLGFEVRNEITDVVPRFMAVALRDISVKPSPLWMQIELVRLGSRPINNIVDVTNYVMLLTGQPLHAYDYDKVARHGEAVLGVRRAKAGETVALLSGKTVQLDPVDIVITDGDRPIGLGGVMGGADTEVSADTKNIILECANFDMYAIRKTSMRHGLFTDAVTRFNKGQSPKQNPNILNLAMRSIFDVAGGRQASAVIDDNPANLKVNGSGEVSPVFINERLGLKLSSDEICSLLRNVEFEASSKDPQTITYSAPWWRMDIELSEDVVEEVGRLYGFDKLPRELPQRTIRPAAANQPFNLKRELRSQMARLGANEVLTYSFVHENLLKRAGQNPELAFNLGNALSPDLQYYRVSVTPSLLDKVHANIKAGYDSFVLFELGKSHLVGEADPGDDGLPKEFSSLSAVYASKQPGQGAAYYVVRRYLDQLLVALHVSDLISYEPLSDAIVQDSSLLQQLVAPFEPGRSAVLRSTNGVIWGVIGEYKASVRKAFKLPDYAAGFEIGPKAFIGGTGGSDYVPLPRFPKVWQDISLKVPADVSYQALYDAVTQSLLPAPDQNLLFTLKPTTVYQAADDLDHKTVTFRYSVASYDKTMTDAEVMAMLDKAAGAAAAELQAVRM